MTVGPIIPPQWPFIYTLAVGQDWPQADEDALRRVAQAWTDAVDGLAQISQHGQGATDRVHFSVQSITLEQFDLHWQQYTIGKDSALGQLVEQGQAVARQLLEFADQTEFTKLSINVQIVLLLIQVTYDLLIAPLTGGLSMGEAFAAMFLTRTIVRELLSRIIEAVIFASVPDLIAQGFMVAHGHRAEIDGHELGQAAQMGVIGGTLAFGAGRLLGRYTPGLTKALGQRGGGLVRAGLIGGVANLGTVTAVNAVDAWEDGDDPTKQFGFADQKAHQNPLAVIANGVFTGMLFHGLHEFSARPTVHFQTDVGSFTGVQTGDRSFTLFPEGGHEQGKMQLATFGDDGVLNIRRGFGSSYDAVPTEFSLSDHGTTVHTVIADDGTAVVTHVEQVLARDEPSAFTRDGLEWTVPKDSVVTYTPHDDAFQVRTPPGQVYASGGDGALLYVGRVSTDPSGAVQHYLPSSDQPVTPTEFHAALDAVQHPAVPAAAAGTHEPAIATAAAPEPDQVLLAHQQPDVPSTVEAQPTAHPEPSTGPPADPAARDVPLPEEYADLRGQVQRTRAGIGGYAADDEPMWRAARAFEHLAGRFVVDMHGNADGVRVSDRPLSASELADLIRAGGWNGRDAIVLLACDTGSGPTPFADALSRALGGAEVLAPTASVLQDPARAMVALGRREWNAELGTFADVSDGSARWLAFHGDAAPTEVGTDHSGLPDPDSRQTHHIDMYLLDPVLFVRATAP
jgi:hypothetical protein